MILLPPHLSAGAPTPGLGSARYQIQGAMLAKQTLYPLSCTPSPASISIPPVTGKCINPCLAVWRRHPDLASRVPLPGVPYLAQGEVKRLQSSLIKIGPGWAWGLAKGTSVELDLGGPYLQSRACCRSREKSRETGPQPSAPPVTKTSLDSLQVRKRE